MSGVDTAWLRMDSPQNLMMIVGVQVFESPMAYDTLHGLLSQRLLRFQRFRQRVENDATGAWWVDDADFDLGRHLVEDTLSGEGNDAQMQAYVAELAGQPLDSTRPLWQMRLVHNYRGQDALVSRIHHCIGDGIALVGVMLSLTDQPIHIDDVLHEGRSEATEIESNPWRPYVKPVTHGTIQAINATELAWEKSLQILANPDKLVDYAQVASQVIKDAMRIALMPDDSSTRLKGKPGFTKSLAWNDPLPLDEVKAVSKALGASINDVLLSCVAGALRDYLRSHGDDTEGCEIRAMVPVNLRPLDQALELGNRFGLVPLTLPVGIGNPIARVREVRRRMDELKSSYQAVLAFALLGVLGFAPRPVQAMVLDTLASKATAVMTNVPGPQRPIHMAGNALSRVMVWVPQSGDIGVGVSILSYNGGVQFGVMTDRGLCADPQRIVDGFAPEFEKLVLTLSLLPSEMFFDPQLTPEDFERALFND